MCPSLHVALPWLDAGAFFGGLGFEGFKVITTLENKLHSYPQALEEGVHHSGEELHVNRLLCVKVGSQSQYGCAKLKKHLKRHKVDASIARLQPGDLHLRIEEAGYLFN